MFKNDKKLELSIIIPVYNVEKYLKECLESVLEIKNVNYEILVINDGSLDNSQKIINEFLEKNDRIKSFLKENGGISTARNYGLKRARGEYIWFVDSDDFIDAKEFQIFFNEVKKEKMDIFIANYSLFKDGKKCKERKIFYDKQILSGEKILNRKGKEILAKGYVWKNLYRKEFLNENGIIFKEGIVIEDQLFNIYCFLKAKKIKCLNNFIYYYRVNRKGSLSNNKETEELFAKSGYEILVELLNFAEVEKSFYVKRAMFAHYSTYVKFFKKRDLELEKKLWKLKGMLFLKLQKKYKIWKFFKKLNKK